MIKEQFAQQRYQELEREINGLLEGKISLDSIGVNPRLKLHNFAKDVESGRIPFSYLKRVFDLGEKLNNYSFQPE